MKDYAKLGFLCGLEIHQQLDTLKLYCDCPSLIRDDQHDIYVQRRLRPVAGERGKIDVAALYEQSKGKYFVYEASSRCSCLVELDEEPPHDMNREALGVALQVAKMMNMKIVDQVHVMRKIVVDGSNVSGFQRTALIAQDGWIETSRGKIEIESLCLEEESAQKGEVTEQYTQFKLDRLGIPLLEVATGPNLQDPEHVKEAAEKIGMIIRSTGKAKRGIGTIRQDVNVNVTGYPRVEIKGFQELKAIPKVVDYEIDRQLSEIEKGGELKAHVRNAKADMTTEFLRPMPGAARMYPETDVKDILITKHMLDSIEIPELIEDKIETMVEYYKLPKDLVTTLVKDNLASFFEFSAKRYANLKPAFIADTLLGLVKQVKKQHGKEINPSQEDYSAVFKALNDGKIAKDSVLDIFASEKPVKDAIGDFQLMSDADLEKELKAIIAENEGVPFKALIGKAMGKLRGKADGRKISEMLKTLAA